MTSVVNPFKILLLACSLLLAGCLRNEAPKTDEVKELKGDIFGSYYIVKYRGDLETSELQTELTRFFQEFNNEFSTYQENSVISKFNELPANEKMSVTPRFIQMLKIAEDFYQKTNGAFDPTLRPVIKAWGFGGGKKKQTPSDADLKVAIEKVGFKSIKWDESNNTVWKEKAGLEIDVNAFAPGWAADLIGEMLERKNIKNFMVDFSGDILFKGTKRGDIPWVAGIETPSKQHAQGVQIAFHMNNQAVSTSGSYRQFFDDKGERKSHIIDPRTGKPVNHTISSASVIAGTCVEADAWSTAFMVLGPKGLDIAKKHDIKVLLLEAKKPNLFERIYSPSMNRFIEAQGL